MYRITLVRNGERLASDPCPTPEVADSFLTALLALPDVLGGAVEEFKDGLGWLAWIPEPDRELLEIA